MMRLFIEQPLASPGSAKNWIGNPHSFREIFYKGYGFLALGLYAWVCFKDSEGRASVT